jgi:hypothetical protein
VEVLEAGPADGLSRPLPVLTGRWLGCWRTLKCRKELL